MLRSSLLTAFVLAGLLLVLSQYLRRTGMFFPDRYPEGLWDLQRWSVTPSEHRFATPDGVTLHAWWFQAAHRDAPVVIWFHGNAGNLTHRAETAAELARRGVSVFLFDYRGFGRSEGNVSESGTFRDSLAAYDYVRRSTTAPLVLYGESIGGPYAAYVARERRGIRGVILENTFPSLRELANTLYAPFPLGWTAPRALRTSAWLNEANVPVLVMHGRRDGVIPYRLGQKLYADLTVPRTMLVSETAGHSEIPVVEGPRYFQAVLEFASARGGVER